MFHNLFWLQGIVKKGSEDDDNREDRTDTVEKRGSKYVVLSEAGKVLGTHDTKAAADAQLRAIEASKRG